MLKGKTALVTGSTSGIGLGIAKALARQGANIVLNGFGDAEGPKAEVAALGVKVGYHDADMGKPGADRGDDEVRRRNLRPRRHPGQQRRHPARGDGRGFPAERWDAIIAINLTSAFHTTRLALPAMKKANWGRIINVASVHGLVAPPRSPPTWPPSTASSASPR
jgi:3-hydroxybutyrate dehydrogenase